MTSIVKVDFQMHTSKSSCRDSPRKQSKIFLPWHFIMSDMIAFKLWRPIHNCTLRCFPISTVTLWKHSHILKILNVFLSVNFIHDLSVIWKPVDLVLSCSSSRSRLQWNNTLWLQSIVLASSWSSRATPRQLLLPPSLMSHWGVALSCLSLPTRVSPCTSPPHQGWTCSEPAASCSRECDLILPVCFSSGLTQEGLDWVVDWAQWLMCTF